MNKLFDKLQDGLLADRINHRDLQGQIKRAQASLNAVELARSRVLLRFSLAVEDFITSGWAGAADIVVLLRQVIRSYHRPLRIRREMWKPIQRYQHESGLLVTEENPDWVELRAKAWQPNWLNERYIEQIDTLHLQRHNQTVIGDGLLYGMSKMNKKLLQPFLSYRSQAQKTAVSAALFAAPGSSTLITLPTGSGKSMCITLPAWFESTRGRTKDGTTLVIVPTVALAYDQQDHTRNYFATSRDEYKPFSLTSDTPLETRSTIYKGIEQGTLPILYTSPEGLLRNWKLYDTCLQAAQDGNLIRFVIDEAHLVDTWGTSFRTEFQLLAAYRNQLLDRSNGQLRTILLSATVSTRTQETLAELFGHHGEVSLVLGNQLRPEPSYWFSHTESEQERERSVLDALHHLPRPAILYVTRPIQANRWAKVLRQAGFKRLAVFSGKTRGHERQALLKQWNQNQLDIMIGTSAFGLGVDKPDVRTVIHATLPENMDRFYQEVGRGGRDGCSTISLTCTTSEDETLSFSMTRGSHITIEKAWPRWQGMWQHARAYQNQGDTWLINLDAVPIDRSDMEESDANRNWNEHILLLMQRADAIRIEDSRPLFAQDEQEESKLDAEDNDYWLLTRIIKHDVVDDAQCFEEAIAPRREEEKNAVGQMAKKMRRVVQSYADGEAKECLAYEFADLYPSTALACGGCPVCRSQNIQPYTDAVQVDVDVKPWAPPMTSINSKLLRRLGARRSLNVVWDEPRTLDFLKTVDQLIISLIRAGIPQILLPNALLNDIAWQDKLVKQLDFHPLALHRITDTDWLINEEEGQIVYPMPTAIVYPLDDKKADKLYQTLQSCLPHTIDHQPIPQLHIVHRTLSLRSLHGLFIDRIEGLQLTTKKLQALLEESEEYL